jgi:hypothetical protein
VTTYEYRTFDGGVAQRVAFLDQASKDGLEYVEGLGARAEGLGSYRVLFRRIPIIGLGPAVCVCVNGKLIGQIPLTGLSGEYPNAIDVVVTGTDTPDNHRRLEIPAVRRP